MLIEIIDTIGIFPATMFVVIAGTILGVLAIWFVFFVSRAWHKGKQSAERR